jgi:hypothetical protein
MYGAIIHAHNTNYMRIDERIELRHKMYLLKARFEQIMGSFTNADWQNPVTNKSIFNALSNVQKEYDTCKYILLLHG